MNETTPVESQQEMMPATIHEPEHIRQMDDAAIVAMMTGNAIEDYVYSFKQGGKDVQGLTVAGTNEAANRRGGIDVDKIEYFEKEHSWLAIAHATDTVTGSGRYGAFEQSKYIDKKQTNIDVFAFVKAIHKAQRNAIKQLLPVPVILEVLNFYLKGTQTQQTTANYTEPSSKQKEVFAIETKLLPDLADENISRDEFWQFIRYDYRVKSRTDMTEKQWTALAAELDAAEKNAELMADLIYRIQTWKEDNNVGTSEDSSGTNESQSNA